MTWIHSCSAVYPVTVDLMIIKAMSNINRILKKAIEVLFQSRTPSTAQSLPKKKVFQNICKRILLTIAVIETIWMVIPATHALTLDRIVAVVNDDVILDTELEEKIKGIAERLRANNTPLPPENVIKRQVLERMIVDRLQLQLAERGGIRVDEETLRMAVKDIAQRNNMDVDQFRAQLKEQGMSYTQFVDNLRGEIAVSRLRASQVNAQVKVTEREIDNFLAIQTDLPADKTSEYRLGHILISTPQSASSAQIQAAKAKAEKLIKDLRSGFDFQQAAVSLSDNQHALNGGDLGWRKLAQIPSLFGDVVTGMKEGDIEGPIRSPSGFHVIKLLGLRGGGATHTVTKTHARHILIRPSDLLTDDEARQKLANLRQRIESGDDFAALARAHSDDKGSAVKGGDLGWVSPEALVPPFEAAMNKLAVRELSEPVQTQFGWHLIQVLEREQSDDTSDYRRSQAREELFKRKLEEETELWLRRLRDEAYVEIRLDDDSSSDELFSLRPPRL